MDQPFYVSREQMGDVGYRQALETRSFASSASAERCLILRTRTPTQILTKTRGYGDGQLGRTCQWLP